MFYVQEGKTAVIAYVTEKSSRHSICDKAPPYAEGGGRDERLSRCWLVIIMCSYFMGPIKNSASGHVLHVQSMHTCMCI